MKKVIVKQNPEAEVPTEVLADAIVAISAGMKKLRSGRLNDKALYLLIQDATPSFGGKWNKKPVTISAVKAVIEGIESLAPTFIRKPVKKP